MAVIRRFRTFRRFNELAEVVITPEGGLAVRLVNKTGKPSVKGDIVSTHLAEENAFRVAAANSPVPCGVVYDAGVEDGKQCLVVISGIAEVLVKNDTAVEPGSWMGVSDAAGRAYSAPHPGGAPPETLAHNREVGHSLSRVTPGTNQLCKVMLHFN